MVLRKPPRDDPRVLPPAPLHRQTRTLSTRAAATIMSRARDASSCVHPLNGLFHGLNTVYTLYVEESSLLKNTISSPALSL